VTTAKGKSHSAVGAIFGAHEGRLVELDGIALDAYPEGYLLVIGNKDEPGVIGHIGTVLGTAKINIARMHLGLKKGEALSLVSVDQVVPEAVLAQLRQRVLFVKQVRL